MTDEFVRFDSRLFNFTRSRDQSCFSTNPVHSSRTADRYNPGWQAVLTVRKAISSGMSGAFRGTRVTAHNADMQSA